MAKKLVKVSTPRAPICISTAMTVHPSGVSVADVSIVDIPVMLTALVAMKSESTKRSGAPTVHLGSIRTKEPAIMKIMKLAERISDGFVCLSRRRIQSVQSFANEYMPRQTKRNLRLQKKCGRPLSAPPKCIQSAGTTVIITSAEHRRSATVCLRRASGFSNVTATVARNTIWELLSKRTITVLSIVPGS